MNYDSFAETGENPRKFAKMPSKNLPSTENISIPMLCYVKIKY